MNTPTRLLQSSRCGQYAVYCTGQDEKSIGLVVQKLYVSSAYAGEAEGLSQWGGFAGSRCIL